MRFIISLILCLAPMFASAQDWEEHETFGGTTALRELRIISSTDTAFFRPIIQNFLLDNPEVRIEYFVSSTADIDRIFRSDPAGFDLVISSAMDLQFKLTNDGFAQPIEDVTTLNWAQWRQSLFGFTSEPAAIAVNRAAFEGLPVPQTRQELIEALRARPEVFRGKIGTYDIRQSGLGYLFATQDARSSETYWRLMEVMGNLNARLYCCSGQMIDDLFSGELVVAYNVLGSYASARTEASDRMTVILPADFPTTMMRTGLVSAKAAQPDAAKAFIRHLLTVQLAPMSKDQSLLPPLTDASGDAAITTITLGPALMTYLDALKRRTFLEGWVSAIIQ